MCKVFYEMSIFVKKSYTVSFDKLNIINKFNIIITFRFLIHMLHFKSGLAYILLGDSTSMITIIQGMASESCHVIYMPQKSVCFILVLAVGRS